MTNSSSKIEFEFTRIFYRYNPTNTYTVKNRDSHTLVYYIKGGHKFDFGDYILEASEGELVYIPFGASYTNFSRSSHTEFYQIDFNFFKDDGPYPIWTRGHVINRINALKYLPIFKKIYEIYAAHDHAYKLLCSSEIIKIIGMIDQEKYAKRIDYEIKKIEKTINYLNESYRLDSSVEELAKISSTSVSNLEKLFKKCFGMSPLSYRNTIRVEHAKMFLAGGYSVSETANRVGFSDVFYFSRVFKKICGISPSRYSKENTTV